MPIDPYSPCPGGTGKKIKFCCSDLHAELDKIQRMLEGEQRAACLEHIERSKANTPDRACLLSIKAMLEAQLGNETKAEDDGHASREVSRQPGCPGRAGHASRQPRATVAAVNLLQDALEKCTEQIPPALYDAIGLVAQVAHGRKPAARRPRAPGAADHALAARRTSGRCSC